MKKWLLSVAEYILKVSAFFGFSVMLFSFHVSANTLVVAPETLESIQGMFYGLEYSQIGIDGALSYLLPTSQDTSKFARYKQSGNDFENYLSSLSDASNYVGINSIDVGNISVGTLDQSNREAFEQMTLYNSNGEVISVDDCTFCNFDNQKKHLIFVLLA